MELRSLTLSNIPRNIAKISEEKAFHQAEYELDADLMQSFTVLVSWRSVNA